jgi:hypothetical protein
MLSNPLTVNRENQMQMYRTREEVLNAMADSLRSSVQVIDEGETLAERERERCAIVGVVKYYLAQLAYFGAPDGPTLEKLSKANAAMRKRLMEIACGEAIQPAVHAGAGLSEAQEILNEK